VTPRIKVSSDAAAAEQARRSYLAMLAASAFDEGAQLTGRLSRLMLVSAHSRAAFRE
jgi:hypothetical protein